MAISLKRLDKSVFTTNLFDNKWLVGAIALSAVLMILVFTVPFMTAALKVVAVPLWVFWVIPISAVYHIIILEVIKKVLFSKEYLSPGERFMP